MWKWMRVAGNGTWHHVDCDSAGEALNLRARCGKWSTEYRSTRSELKMDPICQVCAVALSKDDEANAPRYVTVDGEQVEQYPGGARALSSKEFDAMAKRAGAPLRTEPMRQSDRDAVMATRARMRAGVKMLTREEVEARKKGKDWGAE